MRMERWVEVVNSFNIDSRHCFRNWRYTSEKKQKSLLSWCLHSSKENRQISKLYRILGTEKCYEVSSRDLSYNIVAIGNDTALCT